MLEWVLVFFNLLIGFIIAEILIVVFNGPKLRVPSIPREPIYFGNEKPLTYVILGDSTALSMGGDYHTGYAMMSADHLAKTHRVTFVNLAESGATFKQIYNKQLQKTLWYKPDVVLVAAGANDVLRLTSRETVRNAAGDLINALFESNPDIKVIMTGAPDMGVVIRFPQPLRWLYGRRSKKINTVLKHLYENLEITYVPVFEDICPAFKKNPALFAADKFHPNNFGYDVWIPVINKSLDAALKHQPKH